MKYIRWKTSKVVQEKKKENEMSTKLGTALKSYRTSNGISVKQMAEDLYVDKSTIYKYESGKTKVSSRFIDMFKSVYKHDLTGRKVSNGLLKLLKSESTKTSKTSKKESLVEVVTKAETKKKTRASKSKSTKKSFSESIKSHRSSLGLSLSQYANRYGISKTYIWRMESGSFKTVKSIPVSYVKGLISDGIDLKEFI